MRKLIFLSIVMLIGLSFGGEYDNLFSKPAEFPLYTDRTLMDMVPELESNLNNPEFLYNYAWKAKEEGDYSSAVNYIEKAVALRPQNPFLHFKAGQIYLAKGDNANAQKHFEKALENEYEYLDAWHELIKIAPEYYYNLAQLFGEKAHQFSREDLADIAIGYYNDYLEKFPSGEYADGAHSGIRDMELLKSEIASQKKIKKQREQQQKSLAEKRLAQKREMEEFRTKRRRFVGIFFNTFSPTENFLYTIKDDWRDKCITKRIYQKDLPEGYIKQGDYDTVNAFGVTTLSEFAIGGGYFVGPFILRGSIIMGRSSLKRTYLEDTTVTQPEIIAEHDTVIDDSTYHAGDIIQYARISRDDIPVSSINSLRFSAEGLYNFYYANPLLFYLSTGADFGYTYLDEREPHFTSNWIYGFGLGGGAMLRFSNILIDIGYRYNIGGSSSGGLLVIGAMFKF